MIGNPGEPRTLPPATQIVLTMLLFLFVGPLIAGPFTIPIIWHFSFDDMSISQAIISGLVVTVFGFWAVIAAGAVPAVAVGLTVGWFEIMRGMTDIWIPVASGLIFGIIWGMVIQYNVSEFVAVTPGVAVGSVLASIFCWLILRWVRARRAGRLP